MYKFKLLFCFVFAFYSIQISADMSVEEITLERIIGNTFKSKYGAHDLSVTFKKNGDVFGRTGPGGQWISNGRYEVSNDGTVCIDWHNPRWKDQCRYYGSPNRVIAK